MKRLAAALVLPMLLCAAEAPPLEEVLRAKRVSSLSLSPDGDDVAYGISHSDPHSGEISRSIHAVSTSGGEPHKIADGWAPAWSPAGGRIAFLSARDGSAQIWSVRPDGSGQEAITRHAGRVTRFRWSPDGSKIAFSSPVPLERADGEPIVVDVNNLPRDRLWLVDVSSGRERPLTGADYSAGGYEQWFPDGFSWSPASDAVVFTKRPHAKAGSHLHGDPAIRRLADDRVRAVAEREGMDGYPQWSPTGERIAFISTERLDWVTVSHIYTSNLRSGEVEKLTPEFDEKIKEFFWTPDAQRIFFVAGQGVAAQIFSVDVERRKVSALTEGQDVHSQLTLSADGGRLAFVRQSANEPPAIFVSPVEAFEPRKVIVGDPTQQEWPSIATEIVRWKSFDGMEIEGIVHFPVNYREGERYPLLVAPHGGPHSVMTNTFVSGEYRLFAQRGWLVFRPNFRGSGHYGERYLRADRYGWGVGDYQDVMTGVDMLIERGWADSERMAISGSSYGGYMTTWTISQTNRFRAAVSGAAITDVFSFIRATDVPERFQDYLGTDDRRWLFHSPLYYGHKIRTPTLVWHGSDDLRVPLTQGRQLYTTLQKNNVPAEFVVYPGEGHGVSDPRHARDLMERKIRWLEKWTLGPR